MSRHDGGLKRLLQDGYTSLPAARGAFLLRSVLADSERGYR